MAKAKKGVYEVRGQPLMEVFKEVPQVADLVAQKDDIPVDVLMVAEVPMPESVGIRRMTGRVVASLTGFNGRVEGFDVADTDTVVMTLTRKPAPADKMMRSVPETKGA